MTLRHNVFLRTPAQPWADVAAFHGGFSIKTSLQAHGVPGAFGVHIAPIGLVTICLVAPSNAAAAWERSLDTGFDKFQGL